LGDPDVRDQLHHLFTRKDRSGAPRGILIDVLRKHTLLDDRRARSDQLVDHRRLEEALNGRKNVKDRAWCELAVLTKLVDEVAHRLRSHLGDQHLADVRIDVVLEATLFVLPRLDPTLATVDPGAAIVSNRWNRGRRCRRFRFENGRRASGGDNRFDLAKHLSRLFLLADIETGRLADARVRRVFKRNPELRSSLVDASHGWLLFSLLGRLVFDVVLDDPTCQRCVPHVGRGGELDQRGVVRVVQSKGDRASRSPAGVCKRLRRWRGRHTRSVRQVVYRSSRLRNLSCTRRDVDLLVLRRRY
jgi:hypothetical protein